MGIGSGRGLFYLCAGLGILIGFWEFFYLFQKRRQDFYYSLPLRKSTIFGVRYLHGMCHGLLPIGMIEMKAEMRGGNSLLTMYASFENTVCFLEEHHIAPEKRLADYPVQNSNGL